MMQKFFHYKQSIVLILRRDAALDCVNGNLVIGLCPLVPKLLDSVHSYSLLFISK